METISLCMIVRNEETVLARCLDSVSGLYDELVIVDTGSTDHTRKIAEHYTDHIFDFPWRNDFSAGRNFAFDQATMNFCMWLNADDIILPEDLARFQALKETELSDADVIMARYHTSFAPDGLPCFSCYRERILRNLPHFRWIGAVHEAITPIGTILYTEAAVTQRKSKPRDPHRNLRILEDILVAGRNLTPREQFYYGQELRDHGRYGEAALILEEFLTVGWGWKEDNITACRTLSSCYTALHKQRPALRALLESMAFDAPRAEVCCDLGALFLERGDYLSAIRWYEMALSCPHDDPFSTAAYSDCYGYLPAIQLCVCWQHLGELQKAFDWNEKAGQYRPQDLLYLNNRAFFAHQNALEPSPENKQPSRFF